MFAFDLKTHLHLFPKPFSWSPLLLFELFFWYFVEKKWNTRYDQEIGEHRPHLCPELLDDGAVDEEVDATVADQEQVVQVVHDVNCQGLVKPENIFWLLCIAIFTKLSLHVNCII